MTRLAFQFKGKGGTYIRSDVLHKAPKGMWKGDIIKLSIKSRSEKMGCVMTPKEAVISANALLHAVCLKGIKGRRA